MQSKFVYNVTPFIEAIEEKADVWHRLGDSFNSCYKNIIEAFSETNEDFPLQSVEPQKLSAHALRRDIRRCRMFRLLPFVL